MVRQADVKVSEHGTAEATLTPAEMEVLAKARSVSRRITERVARALEGLPPEQPPPEPDEKPPT